MQWTVLNTELRSNLLLLSFELTRVKVYQLGDGGEGTVMVDIEPVVVELMDSVVLYIVHMASILSY